MPKRRAKPRKPPSRPVQKGGCYIVVWKADDGSLHDPPVAQRVILVAVEPEFQADDLPGAIKPDQMPVWGGPSHLIANSSCDHAGESKI
jgi:hypothetical protein